MTDSICIGVYGAGATFGGRSLNDIRPRKDIKTRIEEYKHKNRGE